MNVWNKPVCNWFICHKFHDVTRHNHTCFCEVIFILDDLVRLFENCRHEHSVGWLCYSVKCGLNTEKKLCCHTSPFKFLLMHTRDLISFASVIQFQQLH
jgi:hypothetical protein